MKWLNKTKIYFFSSWEYLDILKLSLKYLTNRDISPCPKGFSMKKDNQLI